MAQKKTQVRDDRKITVKGVFGVLPDVETLLKATDKTIDLMDLIGIIRKAKPDAHEMKGGDVSEFVRFYGQFRAINCATGEIVEAGQAILPGTIQDKLYGILGPVDSTKEVRFGVRISMKYNKDALRNYVYVTQNLMAPTDDDPLSLLARDAGVKTLMLTAPKETTS